MIKDILAYEKNKDILTQKSEEVTEINDEIKSLIQDLKDTLNAHPDGGVGISAVQIGVLKRICVIKHNNQTYVLINPVITRRRGEVEYEEGCLSVFNTTARTKRAQKVWCTYTAEDGREKELAEGGLLSIIIQHELDHFEGECPVFTAYEEAHKNVEN